MAPCCERVGRGVDPEPIQRSAAVLLLHRACRGTNAGHLGNEHPGMDTVPGAKRSGTIKAFNGWVDIGDSSLGAAIEFGDVYVESVLEI